VGCGKEASEGQEQENRGRDPAQGGGHPRRVGCWAVDRGPDW